ncbi:hypothetical protein GCK72_007431 [Caenorhabditis remanei]|uniref:Uncharacterized protein n=1 Tax=Caenorhabditis remanei TaxID=31234 RepID=A0A6A5HNU6_CAERE|nr:hypothetical protein GCK72_007431 [Caenorhabditis remanei]KAF1767472.1 hypothetical protein GCK72_007431 [Caenorhabditis remanei]
MPPKLSKVANKHNGVKGVEALENRHEKIKRELRDNLSDANGRLTKSESAIVELKKIITQKDEEIAELKLTLMNKRDIENQLKNAQKALESIQRSSEFVSNQVANLHRENNNLKDKINFLNNNILLAERNKEESIRDAVLARNSENIHRKKALDMNNQLNSLKLQSPSGGTKLKKYGDIRKTDTKISRVKRCLEFLKKDVGEDDFDAFITDFCHYIAKDPSFSYKNCLSDMDSFLAVVKFKFSDTVLKDLKKKFIGRSCEEDKEFWEEKNRYVIMLSI